MNPQPACHLIPVGGIPVTGIYFLPGVRGTKRLATENFKAAALWANY